MSEEIDTANSQFVGINGAGLVTVMMPKGGMTRAEALRHAAWLAAVADPSGEDFERVLKAVRGT
jgi:hypothetical protein